SGPTTTNRSQMPTATTPYVCSPRKPTMTPMVCSRPSRFPNRRDTKMDSDQNHAKVLRGVAAGTPYAAMDVFGPMVEFISGPDDPGADFCVMRGVLPPGCRGAAAQPR